MGLSFWSLAGFSLGMVWKSLRASFSKVEWGAVTVSKINSPWVLTLNFVTMTPCCLFFLDSVKASGCLLTHLSKKVLMFMVTSSFLLSS